MSVQTHLNMGVRHTVLGLFYEVDKVFSIGDFIGEVVGGRWRFVGFIPVDPNFI